MTRTRPVQSLAEERSQRHAQTFMPRQIPRDPEVIRLVEQGYLAQQIASILNKPLIDVRLAMAVARKTEVTTRVKRRSLA